MKWFKENQSLATLLIAFGITGIGGVVFWWQQSSRVGELRAELETKQNLITGLKSQPIFPKPENAAVFAEMNTELKNYLDPALELMKKTRIPGEEMAPIDFQTRLVSTRDELLAVAKNHTPPIELPENFAFGFTKYLEAIPTREATVVLSQQLAVVKEIVTILFDVGIKRLISVSRQPVEDMVATPTGKPSTATAGVAGIKPGDTPELLPPFNLSKQGLNYSVKPFLFKFECEDATLRNFFNRLSNLESTRGFYVIRSIEIQNQKTESPTILDLRAETAAPSVETGGSVTNVFGPKLIFGQELMSVVVRVDYIDWTGISQAVKK